MAFEISNDSPIALFSLRLTSKTSSRIFDMQRNAIEVPTLPLPIIEINHTTQVT